MSADDVALAHRPHPLPFTTKRVPTCKQLRPANRVSPIVSRPAGILSRRLFHCFPQARIKRTGEKVHVLSSLQEITCNVDGLTITPARSLPVLSEVELACDASGHAGNKPVRRSALPRLREFADWAFARPGEWAPSAHSARARVSTHSLNSRCAFRSRGAPSCLCSQSP